MRILYLGYWSATDTLTQSVIVPRLQVLAKLSEVKKIFFCSIERQGHVNFEKLDKTEWIGFESKPKGNVLFTKFDDFTGLPKLIKQKVEQEKIDLVIANSPLAGGACYLAMKNSSLPLVVECFEPHADSMLESKVWTRWDPRYWVLKYLEQKQKKYAWRLVTVSEHYTRKLLTEGVEHSKIITLANCLKISDFEFNSSKRKETRAKLTWPQDAVVGIYVGKFGGIYYDKEAFELFKKAFDFFGENYRMIILSGHSRAEVKGKLVDAGIATDKVRILSVPHHEVPSYLSAADFAFATIKPTPIRVYCCPVKDGEYWANGLPVLLEEGIGDDSDIVKEYGGGVIINNQNPEQGFEKLRNLLGEGREELSRKIKPVAFQFRRFELIEEYYTNLLKAFSHNKTS
ncbi:MAG: glycosyltransferase [Bacteroidetes bacterium]|nr:glycosyltransferase [Bacteroidota bacterium]